MSANVTRRKRKGLGAILTFRYPVDEVEDLDAAAKAKGLTRSAFMYAAISRDVERFKRKQNTPALPAA
ncbi:MAG: hypothetical protein KF709_02500 [Gemmatimonadaceae bacterium]|nr:hypothetical protein [Gemmatimonadaceae bacterium]